MGARRISRPPGLRAMTRALCGALLGAALTAPALAERATLDLPFHPPALAPTAICTGGEAAPDPAALWQGFDGSRLPDKPMADLLKSLNRLRATDPVPWFDTIWSALDALERAHQPPEALTILTMRIALLEAAGRFADLDAGGYVRALAEAADALPSATQVTLARYLRDGIGIPADPARADALLVAAGFAGEPSALTEVARRQLEGTTPEGWVIPVELTVTTLLSTRIGELDPGICERASGIARAYQSGDLLTPDPQLAHDWYRFAADMGDAFAAWRVAEFHMQATGITRDTDLMLRYLRQAADAGLHFAQVELSRAHERGAVIPRDLARAEQILAEAAASGEIHPLTQHVLFLRRHAQVDPELDERLYRATQTLAAHPEAPAWVHRDLGAAVLDRQGRWAGRAAALAHFDRAQRAGDAEAALMAARLILADRPRLAAVDAALDTFDRVSHRTGGAQPIKDGIAAVICRSPGPIDQPLARYWLDRFAAINGLPDDGGANGIAIPDPAEHPFSYATAQSELLYGTPSTVAAWRAHIARDPARVAFWDGVAGADTDIRRVAALAHAYAVAATRDARMAVLAEVRALHQTRGAAFGAALPDQLFDAAYAPAAIAALDAAARARALDTLEASAAQGHGRAMEALAARLARPEDQRALLDRFRAVIAARGDYHAQVFAARHAAQPAPFMARAQGVMPCDFRSVMTLLALAEAQGDPDTIDRWLTAATLLADDQPNRLKQLAHVLLRQGGPAERAVAHLARAQAMGDIDAGADLFRLVLRRDGPAYDPNRAIELVTAAAEAGAMAQLTAYLVALDRAEGPIRALFDAELDLLALTGAAAESGQPAAMRLYGLALRDRAQDAPALQAAHRWILRAAEAGDTPAMVAAGQALALGLGTDVNRADALYWLDRATAAGSSQAREITRLMRLSEGT